jgi:hypothetical protein
VGAKHEAIHHLQGPHVDVGHDVVGAGERRAPSPGMTDHGGISTHGKGRSARATAVNGNCRPCSQLQPHGRQCKRIVGASPNLLLADEASEVTALLQFGQQMVFRCKGLMSGLIW